MSTEQAEFFTSGKSLLQFFRPTHIDKSPFLSNTTDFNKNFSLVTSTVIELLFSNNRLQ